MRDIGKFVTKAITRLSNFSFKRKFRSFGDKSGISRPRLISGHKYITIGNNVKIGPNSNIEGIDHHFQFIHNPEIMISDRVKITGSIRMSCAKKIFIDTDVLIAPGVFISDHNHGTDPEAGLSYSFQPLICKEVYIGKGVWLGERVCVLPGASIGEKSIIGANSVVTGNIPSFSVAVGSPARVIKIWSFEEKRWVNT